MYQLLTLECLCESSWEGIQLPTTDMLGPGPLLYRLSYWESDHRKVNRDSTTQLPGLYCRTQFHSQMAFFISITNCNCKFLNVCYCMYFCENNHILAGWDIHCLLIAFLVMIPNSFTDDGLCGMPLSNSIFEWVPSHLINADQFPITNLNSLDSNQEKKNLLIKTIVTTQKIANLSLFNYQILWE